MTDVPPIAVRLRGKEVHEETDLCTGVHCVRHQVDEFGGPTYIRCGECGHKYRTARDLVRAYRRGYWEMMHNIDLPGRPRLRFFLVCLWHLATIRAKDIDFCQFCIHDF